MTFNDLIDQVRKELHIEDVGMLRVAVASIVATRLQIGDPIWMVLIGPSSSGKSQILRPLSLTDQEFIHRIDDLTENTLLSGAVGSDKSLLTKIGSRGILVISDLTVLFSKSAESKAAILSQLRMVYDGEMTKYVGNKDEPITWKGSLAVLSGSTPSIYNHFEEVADMGERFIYYRMKPYDDKQATHMAMKRTIFGAALDNKLSEYYGHYIKDVVLREPEISALTDEEVDRLVDISLFAAKLRTPTNYDKYQRAITRIPIREMPMRVASQLTTLAMGMKALTKADTGEDTLSEDDLHYLEWCAYSLANEERRKCLEVICSVDFDVAIPTNNIADQVGLNTTIINMYLQHLAATGIIERFGDGNRLTWKMVHRTEWDLVRRLNNIEDLAQVNPRFDTVDEDF